MWTEEGELESKQSQPGAEIREKECCYGEAASSGWGMTHAGEHTAVGEGFGVSFPGLWIRPH